MTSFEQDDIFATLESSKAAVGLTIPVSGQVLAFNADLDDQPELVNQDPYGEGWIVRVRLSDWEDDQPMLLSPEDCFTVMQGRVAAGDRTGGKLGAGARASRDRGRP